MKTRYVSHCCLTNLVLSCSLWPKIFIIAMLLLSSINNLKSQDNTTYVDSILSMVTSNRLPIYDNKFNDLSPLDLEIIRCDTVVCDLWSRPKYVDNVFNTAFDGVIVYTKTIYDTLTHPENRNYLQFITTDYDENGNYIGERVVFLMDKRVDALRPSIKNKRLVTKLNEHWINKEIILNGEKISLDTCHLIYGIEFLNNNQFRQKYAPDQSQCHTAAMQHEINVGLETQSKEGIQNFENFHDRLQGHYLTKKNGRWYLQEGQLILWQGERTPLIYSILKISEKELHLKLNGKEYEVIMIKRSNH